MLFFSILGWNITLTFLCGIIFRSYLSACVPAYMLVLFLRVWSGRDTPCRIIKTIWLSCASRVHCNVWHTAEYTTWESSNDTLQPELSSSAHQGGTWKALKLPFKHEPRAPRRVKLSLGALLVIPVMHWLFGSALQWWELFLRLPLLVKHHTCVKQWLCSE